MKLELIYTAGLRLAANNTVLRVIEEDQGTVLSEQDGYVIMETNQLITSDTVIVFITDDVQYDFNWRTRVENLSPDKRIILVSLIYSEGIHLSSLTPANIRKINSIRLNEDGKLDDLWDVLTCDKDYYSTINALSALVDGWEASDRSDLKLLHNLRQIKKYRKMLNGREWDGKPFIREKIQEIIPFLKESQKITIIARVKKVFHSLPIVGVITLALAMIILTLAKIPDTLERAGLSAAVCAEADNLTYSPIQALKAIEALENPFVDTMLKEEAFQVLNRSMCDNWLNTPLANNYKYAQNDIYICDDERYLWAASGQGACLKWDNYTGEIVEKQEVSDSPLYVLDCRNQERNMITVDEMGRVFYLTNGRWITCDSSINESGYAVGVSLSENMACILTDQEKLVILNVEGDVLGIRTVYKYDTVHGFKCFGDHVFALVSEGEHRKLVTIRNDGELIASVNMEADFYESCDVDFYNDQMLYADADGFLHIYHCDSAEDQKLQIVLSSSLIIRFVNDTTLYYNDRNKGNCLYDYRHGIDLGGFLPESGNTSYVKCRGNTVVCKSSGLVFSEDISDILPKEEIEKTKIVTEYSEKSVKSNGFIQNAEIFLGKYILADMKKSDGSKYTYFIDGGHHYLYTGKEQRTTNKELEETSFTFSEPATAVFTGDPTVVGILDDGDTLLIGSSDGKFHEILCADHTIQCVSQKQVPSGSPVVSVFLMDDDSFMIKDQDGLYWKARYGSKSAKSYDAMYNEVKNKLHMGQSDEMKHIVSDTILKKTGVVFAPGLDGKEWD